MAVPVTGIVVLKATTREHAAASARFHCDARIWGRWVSKMVVAIRELLLSGRVTHVADESKLILSDSDGKIRGKLPSGVGNGESPTSDPADRP